VEIPDTRYVRSGEIAIAYQVHGAGPHDILLSGSTASNVEAVWQLPEAHRLFERLGRFARVIRFDRRDTGLSDPIKDDLTIEAHVADAMAVIDAVGAEHPVLIGGLDGARSLAMLAATEPLRASGLIAIVGTARGGAVESPEAAASAAENLANLDWPGDLAEVWAPGWAADPTRRKRLDRYIRASSTPRQAQRLVRLSLTSDISGVLPLVQARTLVLRPEGAAMPAAPVREFAQLIPGAEYREIPGDSVGILYALDIDVLSAVIEEFVTGAVPAPEPTRVLATVLFTDLVASTKRAAELGDRRWAVMLERHYSVARDVVAAHGGRLVKTLGDGTLATFPGPAQALRCVDRVISEAAEDGLQVRSGVHTGEVELVGDDVAGLAVHIAARVIDKAGPGEVIVSRTVRDLVVGSELRFAPRGEHMLNGLPEPWDLYALDRALLAGA
jgi:class 3 adenylate cyclase